MRRDQRAVVHIVNVVGCQNQNLFRTPVGDLRPVVAHRVGSSKIAVAPIAQHHAALRKVALPPGGQMVVQGGGRVLGGDQHPVQPRPDDVRHGEIHDSVAACEMHGRLAFGGGQFVQAAALAARQQDGRNPLIRGGND